MAETITEHFWAAERTLDRELSKHSIFLRLERTTGIKKTHLIGLAVGLVAFLLALRVASDLLLAVVAFAYPAIMTVSAIERNDKSEDTHWLSYWLVLAFWSTLESLTGGLLPGLVPWYSTVKLIGCIWLFMPQTRGATTVYGAVVRPLALMARDHPTMKDVMGKVQRNAAEAGHKIGKATEDAKAMAREAAREVTKEFSREAPVSKDASSSKDASMSRDASVSKESSKSSASSKKDE
ncbi:Protein YOP1 [Paramicrosporidium saccamoebae]|uniref:Protein YOP1 n=1 Tax=Paramicrosporidium saccamoebae TaxID=1246581 RepID=A0A2H9TPJ7_9FUNG|nr:Protein YOP1 [Paramicrosporidium saccamoebae]